MERIRVREGREETPLACDSFDLIGGTSTGGSVVTVIVMSSRLCSHTRSFSSLIALMLGRLGMSVEQAIMCYGTIAGTLFSDVNPTARDDSIKASELEMAVKKIVKEQTAQENEHMIGTLPHAKGCKRYAFYRHSPCCKADTP